MKNYKTEITSKTAENISNYLVNNGYDFEVIEGNLQDNLLAEIGENTLKLGKIKMRKFIIIVEKFLNEWSSSLEMILTDDAELYSEYYNRLVTND